MAEIKEKKKIKEKAEVGKMVKMSAAQAKTAGKKSPQAPSTADKNPKKQKSKEKKTKTKNVPAAKTDKKELVWETIACQFKPGKDAEDGFRAKVPGGWFVSVCRNKGGGVFFYPDPGHLWKGSSL